MPTLAFSERTLLLLLQLGHPSLLLLDLQERHGRLLLPNPAAAASNPALAPRSSAPSLLLPTAGSSGSHLSQAAVLLGQRLCLGGVLERVLRLALALFRLAHEMGWDEVGWDAMGWDRMMREKVGKMVDNWERQNAKYSRVDGRNGTVVSREAHDVWQSHDLWQGMPGHSLDPKAPKPYDTVLSPTHVRWNFVS